MPAIQWYKLCLYLTSIDRVNIHSVGSLLLLVPWRSKSSMADSSTTTYPIPQTIYGGYRAQCQLYNSIRYVFI